MLVVAVAGGGGGVGEAGGESSDSLASTWASGTELLLPYLELTLLLTELLTE